MSVPLIFKRSPDGSYHTKDFRICIKKVLAVDLPELYQNNKHLWRVQIDGAIVRYGTTLEETKRLCWSFMLACVKQHADSRAIGWND